MNKRIEKTLLILAIVALYSTVPILWGLIPFPLVLIAIYKIYKA